MPGKNSRLQREYIRVFRMAGAISPQDGKTLAELGCKTSLVFRRMAIWGVFRQLPGDRWYFDEAEFIRRYKRSSQLLFVFGSILVIATVSALTFMLIR